MGDDPSMSSSTVMGIDVQSFLSKVCDDMKVGELLAADSFQLHEAMMAIEIGDPKMDVGLRRSDLPSVAELITAGEAPVTNLTNETLIAIMDRLMQMEATWHKEGSLLPQTVFTSLYMLDIDRLLPSQPALHAFCTALRSTCSFIYDTAIDGQVCDDEDIMLHTFGIQLDPRGSSAHIDAAQLTLDSAIQNTTNNNNNIICRLQCRKHILSAFQYIKQCTKSSLSVAATECDHAIVQLDNVINSASSLEPKDIPSFFPEINRKSMGLAPPRPVHVLSFQESAEHWKETLIEIAEACRWLSTTSCWTDLRNRLIVFGAKRKNMPIVRSIVHRTIAFPTKNKINSSDQIQQLLEDAPWAPTEYMAAKEFGLLSFLLLQNRDNNKGDTTDINQQLPGHQTTKLFLEQCTIVVQAWCHTMCLNRCRQRRRLRRLLEDWQNMIDHGYNAEASKELQEWFIKMSGWDWKEMDDGDGDDDGGVMMTPVRC